jgi:hypothetical protein
VSKCALLALVEVTTGHDFRTFQAAPLTPVATPSGIGRDRDQKTQGEHDAGRRKSLDRESAERAIGIDPPAEEQVELTVVVGGVLPTQPHIGG